MSTPQIIARALELGATAAGVVRFEALGQLPAADRLDSAWPDGAAALVVLTLAHPESAPELDDWGVPGATAGNHQMEMTLQSLAQWLDEELGLRARPLPYHVERGGVLLKDAAVLAGLGVIGENNLLVTAERGPRVRLRALRLDRPVAPTTATGFAPCDGCPRPCRQACPQRAFDGGAYRRDRCQRQMSLDEAHRGRTIRYCRACELACVVGASRDLSASQR